VSCEDFLAGWCANCRVQRDAWDVESLARGAAVCAERGTCEVLEILADARSMDARSRVYACSHRSWRVLRPVLEHTVLILARSRSRLCCVDIMQVGWSTRS